MMAVLIIHGVPLYCLRLIEMGVPTHRQDENLQT